MLRGIEKRQIDDGKGRQGSVKYLGDLAEKTKARIYAGLSMTNPAPLLATGRIKLEKIFLFSTREARATTWRP
jgi:hypothetical protein